MALLSTQAQAQYLLRSHKRNEDTEKEKKIEEVKEVKKEVVKRSLVSLFNTLKYSLRCVS